MLKDGDSPYANLITDVSSTSESETDIGTEEKFVRTVRSNCQLKGYKCLTVAAGASIVGIIVAFQLITIIEKPQPYQVESGNVETKENDIFAEINNESASSAEKPNILSLDRENISTTEPTILIWTKFFNFDLSQMLEDRAKQCPYKCQYASRENTTNHYDADAIFFHYGDTSTDFLPTVRRKEQIYAAFNLESPSHTRHFVGKSLPLNFFNITFDYRRSNTTYFCPYYYGNMVQADNEEDKALLKPLSAEEMDNVIAKKTSPILAMMSSCHSLSKREDYVTELANYINITFVGNCFPEQPIHETCHSNELLNASCEHKLYEKHYFIFAFENGVCTDYVTEKFFRLQYNIVPIVLRRHIYKGIAPENSFIAADDFNGPEELAQYLESVIVNRTEYERFFDWKKTHIMGNDCPGICDFCRDLHYKNVTSSSDLNIAEHYSIDQCESDTGALLLKSNSTLSLFNVTSL